MNRIVIRKLGTPAISFTIDAPYLTCIGEDGHIVANMNKDQFEREVYNPLNFNAFNGTVLSMNDINILAAGIGVKRPVYTGSRQVQIPLNIGQPQTEFTIKRTELIFRSDDMMRFFTISKDNFIGMSDRNPKSSIRLNGVVILNRREMNQILEAFDLILHFRDSVI